MVRKDEDTFKRLFCQVIVRVIQMVMVGKGWSRFNPFNDSWHFLDFGLFG